MLMLYVNYIEKVTKMPIVDVLQDHNSSDGTVTKQFLIT